MASSTKYGSINEDESDFAVQCENSGKTETSPLISSSKINLNEDSNIWSQLVFKWFTPILYRGNENKKLDQTDLDLIPLPSHCSTEYSSAQFQTYWNQEIRNNPSNPSLVKAIFLSFGSDFVQAGILKFIHDLCLFVGPQVLRGMILYLRQPYERMGSTLLYGLALTASVTCSQIAMSLCLRHYFFKCYSTGLRVRSGIVLAVYNKALCLSAGERQNRTLGEITNLMSIDAERLQSK